MQTTLKKQLLLVALGTVALLTACGGGSSYDASTPPPSMTPPPPVAVVDLPASASQSVEGVITYAKAQLAATSETSDPQNLGTAALFTDETSEPSAI